MSRGIPGQGSHAPKRASECTATAPTRAFRQANRAFREITPQNGSYSLRQHYPVTGSAAVFGEAFFDADGREFPLATTITVLKGGSRGHLRTCPGRRLQPAMPGSAKSSAEDHRSVITQLILR